MTWTDLVSLPVSGLTEAQLVPERIICPDNFAHLMQHVREAAKKGIFFVARPLRRGEGKGRATKKKEILFKVEKNPKNNVRP